MSVWMTLNAWRDSDPKKTTLKSRDFKVELIHSHTKYKCDHQTTRMRSVVTLELGSLVRLHNGVNIYVNVTRGHYTT